MRRPLLFRRLDAEPAATTYQRSALTQGEAGMGLLVDGVWQDSWYDTAKSGGRFIRSEAQFRNWVTPDGSAGPSGHGGFKAEPGRYHLYVSLACPWALAGADFPRAEGPRRLHLRFRRELVHGRGRLDLRRWPWRRPRYGQRRQAPARGLHQGRPHLFRPRHRAGALGQAQRRHREQRIPPRSSACSTAPSTASARSPAITIPKTLRDEIDRLNAQIYDRVNNGVYKAGFATAQAAYEEAVRPLFATLD